MEKHQSSIKLNRKKKFYLLLPVFAVPFITFFLWTIGLIGGNEISAKSAISHGLNVNLPGILTSKDSSWNKLRYYEQADKDSANYNSLLKADPYYRATRERSADSFAREVPEYSFSYDSASSNASEIRDVNEEKVYMKLSELKKELRKQPSQREPEMQGESAVTTLPDKSNGDYIEKMLKEEEGHNNPLDTIGDPELHQLDNMLNKILDIQHPERSTIEMQKASEKTPRKVFPVSKNETSAVITVLGSGNGLAVDSVNHASHPVRENSFHSLDNEPVNSGHIQNSVSVFFPESQTISLGSVVKMQLLTEMYVNGLGISIGEFIYGTASVSNGRLLINVNSIRSGNNILPVSLSAYDLDGLLGMYIPNAVERDAIKQSGSDATESVNFSGLDPSLGAQAANAGIQAAKTLFSKKIKQLRITVKAGYEILLVDNEQNKK